MKRSLLPRLSAWLKPALLAAVMAAPVFRSEAASPDQRAHLYFFGGGDHTTVEGHPDLYPGEGSYSWEFWALIDPDASGWGLPIEYPGGNRYYVGYNLANGWNFIVTAGGSRTDTNADRWLARITGRWVFVQAVLDAENRRQTLRVYDWANDTWHEANVTPGDGPNHNSGTLYIPSPPGRFPYHGSLQEMRFWRTVRTQADAENDMMNRLTGSEENLEAYWPMNEGTGDRVFNQVADTHHGTIVGNPRWDSGWRTAFDPVSAPVDFDFGTDPGQDDGEKLLRNFPDKFTLVDNGLRYGATRNDAFSSTALAVVENYLNRQNFVLDTTFLVNRFGGTGGTRVGLAALGGPHSPETRFDSINDRGFYGFVWVPARDAQTSALEIREGFRGPLLAEVEWTGLSPATREAPDGPGEGVVFFEGFEDLAAVNATWTTGGLTDIWEFGEPAGGPGSAYAGQNVAGTGLGADDRYPANTEAWLRSPVIDLSGEAGPLALSFREYLQVDPEFDAEGFFHFTIVNILDGGHNLIAEVSRDAGLLDDWRLRQIQIPEEALGGPIMLEFRLESDAFMGDTFDGWFLDNIAISGFQPMEFQMAAAGNYLRTGELELVLTLTDENGHEQTLTATTANPITGNLFGFGGQLEPAALGNWEFSFADFGIELGTWSLPLSFGPSTTLFGTEEGRAGAGNFFQNLPEDWSTGETGLFHSPVATEPRNSWSVGQIGNFEAGESFYTRLSLTVVGLDTDVESDNAVGLVLFGDEDPEVFDAANDATFHSLQWLPNPAGGPRLVFRQGMAGPVVDEVSFGSLPTPPELAAGRTYVFEFFGTYLSSGDLPFVARLRDGENGVATLSGSMENPPAGNHFGFGARHGAAGDPVWQYNRYDWFNIHPVPQPVDLSFGTGSGRDDARDFFKSGERPRDWSLEEDALRLSRGFLSGAGSDAATAMAHIAGYQPGTDFALRSTVTASETEERPVFLRFDGVRDYIQVAETQTLMPMADDYTWEFWARVDNTATGWNIPIEFPSGDRHYVGYNAGNGWNFMLVSNSSRTDTFRDRYIANFTGRWVFVQAVLDRQNSQQTLRVYDSAEETWHEAQVIPALGQTQNSGNLFIPSANASFRFNGDLREMRFWRKARSRSEAEADMEQPLTGGEENLAAYWPMNEGTGEMVMDQSTFGNNGTFVGEPEWVTFETAGAPADISLSQFGPFPRFDGNPDHYGVVAFDSALTPGEDSYSWEFWSRIDPEATDWNLPIEYRGGNRYYVGYRADAGWNFIVTAGGVRTDTNSNRWLARLTGQWVFVQAVLDVAAARQTLRVYDPVKDQWHEAQVTPGAGPNNNTGVMHLPSTVFPYQGDLQEVRFWRAARSQADAAASMFTPLVGDEPGLAAYWPMNEGFGSTLLDRSANGNHSEIVGSPRWITGGSLRNDVTLGLTALGNGGTAGSAGDFFARAFRLEWLPSANLGGGELWLSSPEGATGRGLSRFDFSGTTDAPLFVPGGTYTFELSGFYQPNGTLSLVGSVADQGGNRVEVVHHVQDPAALQLDSWFGVAGKLPESATRYDWHTFRMGTPQELGIEPPDFGIRFFGDWSDAHFTEGERANPAISGPLAAPAGDGIANLLKYALGFDPWTLVRNGDLTRMEMSGNKLRLTYAERRDAADLDYIPQHGLNLADWSADGVVEVSRIDHPDLEGFDLVTVEVEVTDEVNQAFLRVLISEKP